MSKFTLTVAAAVIAVTSFANGAQAGMKVGFGFPLGAFVASQHSPSGPGSSARRRHHSSKKASRQRAARQRAAARARAKAKAQAQAKARAQAEARAKAHAKAEARAKARKAAVARAAARAKSQKVAASEQVEDTQDIETTTADIALPIKREDVIETGSTTTASDETAEKTVEMADVAHTTGSPAVEVAKPVAIKVERLCRKFSATVAAMIEVPCD